MNQSLIGKLQKLHELKEYISPELAEVVNVMKSSGKSRNMNDYPVLQIYLEETGMYPYIKNYSEISLNHVEFLKDFEKEIDKVFHMRNTFEEKTMNSNMDYGFFRLARGYFVEVNVGYHSLDTYDVTMQNLLRILSHRENTALISNIVLLCPPDDSPLKNPEIEERIEELIKKHKLERNTTTPSIGMICSEDGDFYIKDFYIKKDYSIADGDLHYGEGFLKFHANLVNRFKQDPKGLVLFHGTPGTGKTFYIRSLIKELLKIGKYVIYIPPGMVESIVDPNMMTFLSNTVVEKAEEGKSCVLLLEDAEPLLASRKTESRSGGITNLLNVTDGLLNDMLSMQVIATFNTDLSNIDEALLRPERLIARKEFKKLKREDAQKLATKLGLEKIIEKDSTLAEIYSQSRMNEILVHEYNVEEKRIGFK
jgi:hypothetical protein